MTGARPCGADHHVAEQRGGRRPLASLLFVLATLPSLASAHAYLDSSDPAANAVVTESVTTVTLTFSEGVEVAFSTFKVYRLAGEVDLAAENANLRLNALAALVVTDYNGKPEDGEGKVDAAVSAPAGDKASVTLSFHDALEPGHYVVMWRVLSTDTHVIDGHLVFTVAKE